MWEKPAAVTEAQKEKAKEGEQEKDFGAKLGTFQSPTHPQVFKTACFWGPTPQFGSGARGAGSQPRSA